MSIKNPFTIYIDETCDVPEIHAGSEKELDLFISNFKLLYANKDLLCTNPDYANITIRGIAFSYAFATRGRPLTLGEILYHYSRNEWITEDENGKKLYIYSASGSPLSGRNSYAAFSDTDGKITYGHLSSTGITYRPIIEYEAPFPFVPSTWTLEQLLGADIFVDKVK